MHYTVKAIRSAIAPEVEFDFWVRRFKTGHIWVGATLGTEKRMNLLVRILMANGYNTECIGKPGTVGEFIIDVINT